MSLALLCMLTPFTTTFGMQNNKNNEEKPDYTAIITSVIDSNNDDDDNNKLERLVLEKHTNKIGVFTQTCEVKSFTYYTTRGAELIVKTIPLSSVINNKNLLSNLFTIGLPGKPNKIGTKKNLKVTWFECNNIFSKSIIVLPGNNATTKETIQKITDAINKNGIDINGKTTSNETIINKWVGNIKVQNKLLESIKLGKSVTDVSFMFAQKN
jgi:hypothetical protein